MIDRRLTRSTDPRARWRELLDHPRGLWVLTGTELWERISFHGMQALLTLYMVEQLLLPDHIVHVIGFATFRGIVEGITGPLSVTALAAQTFGLYVGLIYFTPVVGGWLGDRVTGRRGAVMAGALLMTAGHFALAFDASFLLALLLLIVGAGLLRGNLSAQIKALYADGDRREADAFQLYYVGINLGAFIAPIVTGALAVVYGWHAGFAFAGFGMLAGLLVYVAGQRHLPADSSRVRAAKRDRLKPAERTRLSALLAIWPLMTCFWIAQSQVWNVYNLWVRDHLDRRVGGVVVPVPWLQALDGLAPVLVMPLFLSLWRRQAAAGREPDSLAKLAIGCLVFGGGTAWLSLAPLVSDAAGRVPLLWAVAFHLLTNIGWLYVTPIGLALYAAEAPSGLRGTMIGINTLSTFAGSVISGRLGSLYERWAPAEFWLLHAAVVAGAGVVLLVIGPTVRRRLLLVR
ncbi:peptide MFS transporter [Sphingomonas yunnanensis]|uniref:peptide MFS transporter n=1 Tax=Sphingomonas yunnanensis TaxID=310400 RepID=UPI001CA71CE9|nr:peptide MFS transporter [Sphingomonas yunnanensis]MBY9063615.1 peptide MFS transporter [Sphingomonas yunnanensis]